jgi:hypothetical protein
MERVQRAFRTLLAWGVTLTGKAGALCRNLQEKWPALWTFLAQKGSNPLTTTQKGFSGRQCCGARLALDTRVSRASST